MHKSLQRLEAVTRGQGIPSLWPRVSGATCTTNAAKAAAPAAFAAEVARGPAPSVACAHAALAAELANPGHDTHRLGDEFMFDEVRDCQRSLQNYKAPGSDGIPAELLK